MTFESTERVWWKGQQYFGIEKLGFTLEGHLIVGLYTTPLIDGQRGTYFTTVPLSPLKFRKENPHLCKGCAFRDDGEAVTIFCDWGRPHGIAASRAVLEQLIAECRANELPELEAVS